MGMMPKARRINNLMVSVGPSLAARGFRNSYPKACFRDNPVLHNAKIMAIMTSVPSPIGSAAGRQNGLHSPLEDRFQFDQFVRAVLDESPVSDVEWDVIFVLRNDDAFLSKRVTDSEFIEDIRISTRDVNDDQPC